MEEIRLTESQTQQKIIELGIATEAEVILVTNINGYTKRVLNSIVNARTGYETIESYIKNECEAQ